MLSKGSQGQPRIFPGCLHTHNPPGNPEDPKDIPRFFLDNPTHIALQAVWRSPHARYFRQSRGSRGFPKILPGCSHMHSPPGNLKNAKGIPRSSLEVSHIHSPCCPQDPNDIPVSSLNIHPHSPLGSPEDPMILPGCPHTRSTTHDPDMTQSAFKWLEKA